MSWNELFKDELRRQGSVLSYYTSCLVQNWRFVSKIKKYLPEGKQCSVLEPGAGTGFLAVYFASLGHNVCAMDLDVNFIEQTNRSLQSNLKISSQDIRHLPEQGSQRYDLIYNIGVMEHFNDGDMIKMFKSFNSMADVFIFAVPNFKIPHSYGDERYLSKRHWRKLLKDGGWRLKETFSYNRLGLRNYLSGFTCERSK